MNHTADGPLGRVRSAFDAVMRRICRPARLPMFWFVPPLLGFRWRRYTPPRRVWTTQGPKIPDRLRDVPGIRRDAAAEDRAAVEAPLRDWIQIHHDTVQFIVSHGWSWFLWSAPRKFRAKRAGARNIARGPAQDVVALEPKVLTSRLKERAAELGISAVGVAPLDLRYIFTEFHDAQVGDRVVVLALESQWEACQTAPSLLAQRGLTAASVELSERMVELGQFLLERGYRIALPKGDGGDGVVLHFALEAGMGQMGLNGQLLTPAAGSRARFLMFTTDAPLTLDHPRDFGIRAVCDACQVCVRRCPAGAIPANRDWHRGVEKAKLNAHRCVPVLAQTPECAVCMKVCPVQRYGLGPVVEEFESTGRILGKDTDELEAYTLFGERYGVGERPRLSAEFYARVPYTEPSSDATGGQPAGA